MKAHQRLIREKRALEDSDADLFGKWWQGINVDIGNADIREISYETAKSVIEKYEWLGTMPAIVRHCYGIFFDGACGGAVVYSDEYAENLGVWDKYGYTGKIICLSRGACVHWAHPHSASKLIRRSIDLLPSRYQVITCTVDATAGEVGTIYQACGFVFVGVMSEGGKIASIRSASGKAVSAKSAMRMHGTRGHDALVAMGVDAIGVPRKSRYFCFRGSRKEIKVLRQAIAHKIKPYPKRHLGEQD